MAMYIAPQDLVDDIKRDPSQENPFGGNNKEDLACAPANELSAIDFKPRARQYQSARFPLKKDVLPVSVVN